MAIFKFREVFNGNITDIFNLFVAEATKPFDTVVTGYTGTKQCYQKQGISVETEITGFEPDALYQVTVRLPDQEYVKRYGFSTANGVVHIDYTETFHTPKPILAINHWLMSYMMKKSLRQKVSLALQPLRQNKPC